MNEQLKNALIGFFILTASTLTIAVLLFLQPSVGDGQTILRVRFPNIEKISVGSRVTFAGRHVGQVEEIRQVRDARQEVADLYGNVYAYELVLRVDSSVEVFDTDDISIHTSGLLGERSISIRPNAPQKGRSLKRVNEDIIYAKAPSSVEETMSRFSSLALKAGQTLDEVSKLIASNNEEISHTIRSFRDTAQHLDKNMNYIEKIDLFGAFKKASDRFADAMDKINRQMDVLEKEDFFTHASLLTQNVKSITNAINKPEALQAILRDVQLFSSRLKSLQEGLGDSMENFNGTLSEISVMAHNLREISTTAHQWSAKVQAMLDHISSGKGDLGRLIYDDNLHFAARGMMRKLHTVVNDVNHYGLLFHLDKGWQRQRTKRMNILGRLESPQQFRSFFNEEVDQISTSLARVSKLVEQGKESKSFPMPELKRLLQEISDLKEIIEILQEEKAK